jgi:Mn2+/Fe2+ NRAMP family transporter
MSAAGPPSSLTGALIGAAFLMATSAIGPGFLTQTAVFTASLGASFGFAVLLSALLDVGAQLTVWRVLVASGRRAPDVADAVLPGLGTALALLVGLGGLAFNIGNVAGAGLGLQALLDLPVAWGAALSAGVAVLLFLSREAQRAMDRFALVLGLGMIALTAWIAVVSRPPHAEAALRSVAPVRLDPLAIVTLVGGTVGGYITFAGAHRLLDAGVRGPNAVGRATRSAVTGITLATVMRTVLFLAALGVVSAGHVLDPANPPASVFRHAAGALGGRAFGLVMWAAAVTSVVGSAYTSISFFRRIPAIDRRWRAAVVAFVAASTVVFLLVGRPVTLLVLAGALNGLVLPASLAVMLLASRRRAVVGDYRHPPWLAAAGLLVALGMGALGAWTLATELPKLW